MCVACHLILRTVANVDLYDDGGPEKDRFCRLSSLHFCERLMGMENDCADILCILLLNLTLSCRVKHLQGVINFYIPWGQYFNSLKFLLSLKLLFVISDQPVSQAEARLT